MSRLARLPIFAILSLAAAVALPWSAAAQTSGVPLSGRVVDEAGLPVPGATVTVRDSRGSFRKASTGGDGAFSVTDVERGMALVTVSSPGWQSRRMSAEIPAAEIRVELKIAGLAETVVVIGEAGTDAMIGGAATIGSVDVIGADQLARENVDLSYELLKKVPGVYVNDFNQGVVAGGIGIRGFNTEGDILHTKLLIDGIPSNMNSGNGALDSVLSLDLDRIEIVKGTQDPRFGLLNIAGNVQATTSAPGRYTKAKLFAGAYGTVDAQGVTAFNTGRLSHVYSGGYRESDGYRDNSEIDRLALSGKWFFAPAGDRFRIGAIVRAFDFETEAPGYLTLDEARTRPRSSPLFSATDGGEHRFRHVSVHADRHTGGPFSVSAKAYYQTFEQSRFVRFTAASAQQERFEDEAQTGATLTATVRPSSLAAREAVFSFGADYQSQDNLALRYRTVDRVRGAVLRDQDFTFSNGGAFASADLRPVPWLRINAGARADRFGGDFKNRQTAQQLPIIKYGTIWQPKAGVMATPREGLNLYANYGRSFQVGVGSAAYGRQPLGHSRNDGWETGFRVANGTKVAARVGVWGQDASNELRLKFDNSGDSENVGKTRRRGWNMEVTLRPGSRVYLWGTYTRQRATLVEPGARQPELRGKELNHVPRYTAKGGMDLTLSAKASLSMSMESQGDYFLTTANTGGRFGDRTLVGFDAFYRVHPRVSVGAHVKNLFDAYHEYAWFDGATSLHSPGERRAAYITATLGF